MSSRPNPAGPDRDWFARVAENSTGPVAIKRIWVPAAEVADYPVGRTVIDDENDWRVEHVGPRIASVSNGIRQMRHPVFIRAVSAAIVMQADEGFWNV